MNKNISIELLSPENSIEILQFEKENRQFFESNLPSRGDGYYNTENYHIMTQKLLKYQNEHKYFMHVIRNSSNSIIGRVNLYTIENNNHSFKIAELGYRFGKKYTRQGYATEAVKLVLEKAFREYHFNKIEAGTAIDNLASQKVLLHNNFKFIRKIEKNIELNGILIPSLIFEKSNPY